VKSHLAWVVVTVGLFGCGAQELPGGAQDAGRDLNRLVIDDATEQDPGDAGCPPEGKVTCAPLYCGGASPEPQCIHGGWSCESLGLAEPIACGCGLVPFGCSCDPSNGAISCPVDATNGGGVDGGGLDARTSLARDAGTRCSPLVSDGGYYVACGCGSDSTPAPACVDGAWTCPSETGGPSVCPPVRRCYGPQPSGCFCNPTTGALTCAQDAGADAPSN
jgi:hypothetical protein